MQNAHLAHIQKNKKHLEIRSQMIRSIREFFWQQDFLEVETPLLLRLPGQEPYLSPMKVAVNNERNEPFAGYLHTSPEYTLKKMLAAGCTNIFSLCKTFRNNESFGGHHNPEFTMLEWYRTKSNFVTIMDDVENLFTHLSRQFPKKIVPNKFVRMHMKDIWQTYAGIDLDKHLETKIMYELCKERGYSVREDEPYEDLFYRIFLNEIEPQLPKDQITIIHHYPAQMAALATLSKEDDRYAERFEVYIGDTELANAFTELTDADEQLRRLEEEQALRQTLGKDIYDIDMEFIDAVGKMPNCAGIALGIDRLVQLYTGCENIDDVLVLPASRLFNT